MNLGQRLIGYAVTAALVLAVFLYVVRKVEGWLSNHDAQTTRASGQMVKLHDSNVRFRAKLERVERARQASAAAAHDSANVVRIEIAQLPLALRGPKIVHVARLDSTAYAMCSVALYTCQQRATLAEQEAHRLTHQLGEQMKVRDRRCGIFAGYGAVVYNDLQRDAAGVTTSTIRARFAWQLGVGCRLMRIPLLPLP